MGNAMVGGVCGAAMAALVAVLVLPSYLGLSALIGGALGAVMGARGEDVATFTGMRLLRYAFLLVIIGLAAIVFGGLRGFLPAQ